MTTTGGTPPRVRPSGASPVVGRVYVRPEAGVAPSVARASWPGPGWRQLGLISPDLEIADDAEVMVVIDPEHSSPRAALCANLPARVDRLRFHGRRPPSRAWLHELPDVHAAEIALGALPPPDELEMVAACEASLTELTLGSWGRPAAHSVASLGFLAELAGLRRLCLHGVDLRGSLPPGPPVAVEHLVARLVPAPDPMSWPWHGLDWLERFPALRSVELGVPHLDPQALRSLACLSRLESLKLSLCHVTAAAVAAWRSLPHLRELRLADARIWGRAIREFAEMPALRTLELSEVELDELDLRALAAAPALEDLTAEAGTIGADVGLLAPLSLRRLCLGNSTLEDGALDGLGHLVSLHTLDLSSTDADEAAAARAAKLPALAELSFADCWQVSLGTVELDEFRELQSLDISGTLADGAIVRGLASLPRLVSLRASALRDGLSGERLAFAPSLVALHLDGNVLGVGATSAIATCSLLETLSLRRCAMEADELLPLAKLSRLRSLRFSPRGALPEWLPGLGRLQELVVDGALLSGERLRALTAMRSLLRLDLVRCRLPATARDVIAELKRLEALSLEDCQMTGSRLLSVLPTRLRSLRLTGSDVLDDDVAGMRGSALESFSFLQTAVTPSGLLRAGETPKVDVLTGPLVRASERELELLVARFPACWSLLDVLPASKTPQLPWPASPPTRDG